METSPEVPSGMSKRKGVHVDGTGYGEEAENSPFLVLNGQASLRQIFITDVSERSKKGITSSFSPIQPVHFITWLKKEERILHRTHLAS